MFGNPLMIFSISLMEIGLSNSNGVNFGQVYFPRQLFIWSRFLYSNSVEVSEVVSWFKKKIFLSSVSMVSHYLSFLILYTCASSLFLNKVASDVSVLLFFLKQWDFVLLMWSITFYSQSLLLRSCFLFSTSAFIFTVSCAFFWFTLFFS